MCASFLFHQQNFPFMNTIIIAESLRENSVCIDNSMVGETTELNVLETA